MCKCKNIAVGSYDRQTSMKHNFTTNRRAGDWVCVDTCLVQEIAELWHLGIKTIECCCGHNKVQGYIAVDEKHIKQMKDLDYKTAVRKDGIIREEIFYPKTKY